RVSRFVEAMRRSIANPDATKVKSSVMLSSEP
ncbi:MAG: phosphorybosylanthranilate isomerase, partial [Acaryochloridaceae cyanobacterium CSU_3_4]|nr:phosphorybosylanthranilate isomerase [Acaryochloridaceae cyanobacterium CSU_3_4]